MAEQPRLPTIPAAEPTAPPREPTPLAQQRVARAVRTQLELIPQSLDDRLAADHPARAIWALLERLDLTAFYAKVRVALAGPGRAASDPQVLLGLWLLATVEGIGSARKLARLSDEHDAYRWLRGGVAVNYHLLSTFRVAHEAALNTLLTQTIAVLLDVELVTLQRVAQDGVRVRASAGASSFRRRERLEQCQALAQAQVEGWPRSGTTRIPG